MAWSPIDTAPERGSWKKEVQRGPRPQDVEEYSEDARMRDRIMATTFGGSVALVGALALVIILALAFYAQYSGSLRWLLAVLVLAFVAYAMARLVGRKSRDPRALAPREIAERRMSGDLRSLTTTLDRAASGMKYSQVMFAVRMKDAFLEKVRVSRGLSRDAVDRARTDPEALMAIVGDRELALFVLESERNGRHWPALLRYLPDRDAFPEEMDRILAKMEAWR